VSTANGSPARMADYCVSEDGHGVVRALASVAMREHAGVLLSSLCGEMAQEEVGPKKWSREAAGTAQAVHRFCSCDTMQHCDSAICDLDHRCM
jgi:coproporphyrinogen III oxidase